MVRFPRTTRRPGSWPQPCDSMWRQHRWNPESFLKSFHLYSTQSSSLWAAASPGRRGHSQHSSWLDHLGFERHCPASPAFWLPRVAKGPLSVAVFLRSWSACPSSVSGLLSHLRSHASPPVDAQCFPYGLRTVKGCPVSEVWKPLTSPL